ncbi:hypothetical protein [Marinobacter sp. ATCH36]|uniref:hypothetical protein n=1 Tax=Marinobacter sp. ATCH36 TaxID=2945106 RepID=UPI0020203F38|nr:hypothetical protein [Marinobacter sp. ATCH36]MCL7944758.1 hypothetical protein [Marinobacter sp. ATCH36]
MTIVKKRLTENFATIPNSIFDGTQLSLDTIGVLVYLLSLPENWEVRADHIRRKFNIGKAKQQRIFKELENAGYLIRDKAQGTDGRWTTGIKIRQVPQKPAATKDGSSGIGFSGNGRSDTGAHGPLCKTISNKKYSKNKNITNTQPKPDSKCKNPTPNEEITATRSNDSTSALTFDINHGDISWLWES